MLHIGIDVSPGKAHINRISPDPRPVTHGGSPGTNRIESWELTDLSELCHWCMAAKIIVIETPDPGLGYKASAVASVMRTALTAGEIFGRLTTAYPNIPVLQAAPPKIRYLLCGWDASKGKADPYIKKWLQSVNAGRAGSTALFKAGGALSTPDKRDAHMAALFGKRMLESRALQLEMLGGLLQPPGSQSSSPS